MIQNDKGFESLLQSCGRQQPPRWKGAAASNQIPSSVMAVVAKALDVMTPGPIFFDVEGMSCTARWALVELAPANLHFKVPMGGMLHELHASHCDNC